MFGPEGLEHYAEMIRTHESAPEMQEFDDLDPEQREAVLASSGPVAILAGAGTGKTRVISRRTAYAIATEAVPPDQVLVVTFTDKAAGEMVARLPGVAAAGAITLRTAEARAPQGIIRVQAIGYEPGRPGGPAVIESGRAEFDSAAVSGARKLRFVPGRRADRPIEMWTKLPVRFEVDSVKVGR